MKGRHRTILSMALCLLLGVLFLGCEKKEVEKQTEVRDKLLGGKEVKETEVTREGEKVQVKERKDEIDGDGVKVKTKIDVKGDDLD